MSSARNSNRSTRKYRGRHAAPTQAAKIAGKATMAAPAIAVAGVMIGGPQLQGVANAATTSAATASAASTTAVTASEHASAGQQPVKTTLDAATTAKRTYQVVSGDTLSGISDHFYGTAGDWRWLYEQNTAKISDPNLIYPGQVLAVPSGAPSPSAAASVQAPAASVNSDSGDSGNAAAGQSSAPAASQQAAQSAPAASQSAAQSANSIRTVASSYSSALSGTLGCSSLEQLWEDAGGNPADAFMAAEIAMAESGGNQYAVSPTADYGYWQINSVHGAQATFDPIGNAQAAVSISADGTNWTPWTTYTSGAYQGRC